MHHIASECRINLWLEDPRIANLNPTDNVYCSIWSEMESEALTHFLPLAQIKFS